MSMSLNGHGYSETLKSRARKPKNVNGFVSVTYGQFV